MDLCDICMRVDFRGLGMKGSSGDEGVCEFYMRDLYACQLCLLCLRFVVCVCGSII